MHPSSLLSVLVTGAVVAGTLAAGSPAAVAVEGSAAPARESSIGPVPRGFHPVSVTFISERRGWALGASPCRSGPCTAVLRTSDGGRTWRAVGAPKVFIDLTGDGVGVHGVRFADARNGFAYGSLLYATHDGGAHWHRIGALRGVADITVGGGRAYATVRVPGGVEVYRTSAGSDRWRRVRSLPTRPRTGEWFARPGTVTVHGRAVWVLLGHNLYRSPSGGTWTRHRLPCPTAFERSLAAYDVRRLSLLCLIDAGAGSSGKVLYASTDGGRTWHRRGRAPLPGVGGMVARPGPSQVLVGSSSAASFVYLSRDGGRSWRTTWQQADTGSGLAEFSFVSRRQGALVVDRYSGLRDLYLSRDGGRNWNLVRF